MKKEKICKFNDLTKEQQDIVVKKECNEIAKRFKHFNDLDTWSDDVFCEVVWEEKMSLYRHYYLEGIDLTENGELTEEEVDEMLENKVIENLSEDNYVYESGTTSTRIYLSIEEAISKAEEIAKERLLEENAFYNDNLEKVNLYKKRM